VITFPLRIYISSSWKGDLDDEKGATESLIEKELLMSPVYPSVASPLDITSDYYDRLRVCDIVIVLLGSKYSENVEKEFGFALNNNIPTLGFKKECEHEEALQKKIETLYHIVSLRAFRTVEELKKEVKTSIIDLLGKTFQSNRKIVDAITPLIGSEIKTYHPKPSEREYKGGILFNPPEPR